MTVVHGPATTHGALEHLALFHRGPDELADRLPGIVTAALDRDEAVLLCLMEDDRDALLGRLGTGNDVLTVVANDERYAHPGAAMALVRDFVDAAVSRGAPRALSIGTLPFSGDRRLDGAWLRYEAAVNALLAPLPLTGLCTFDAATLAPPLIDAALATHVVLADGAVPAGPSRPPAAAPARGVVVPESPPLLSLTVEDTGGMRHVLAAVGDDLAPGRLDDLLVVATELASNGVRHGRPPVELAAWRDGDLAVLRVVDRGDGIPGPYPDLLPNRGGAGGGFGWWIIGQMAHGVDVERVDGLTVVTVSLRVD